MVHGSWFMATYGSLLMVHGSRFMAYLWFMVNGSRFTNYGAWFMVNGSWLFMATGNGSAYNRIAWLQTIYGSWFTVQGSR